MNKIYKDIINETNIYAAYYSLESYLDSKITDKALIHEFNQYKDRNDFENVNCLIKKVIKRISQIIIGDDVFTVKIRFEVKKVDQDGTMTYRPLHQTTNIVDLISMVSILNILVKDYRENSKVELSRISKSIPDNFFGSIPSNDIHKLYEPWTKQYSKYTETYINLLRKYSEEKTYDTEINLDIKNFFPSINPKIVVAYLIEKFNYKYSIEEIEKVIYKLCIMKIEENKMIEHYYRPNLKDSTKDLLNGLVRESMTIGVPQGLPQSYFFANIIMIEISRIFDNEFGGKAIYYVDDSIRFIKKNKEFDMKKAVKNVNEKISTFESIQIEAYKRLFNNPKFSFVYDGTYGINIHEYFEDHTTKTTMSTIEESQGELINFYLGGLTKNASVASWEINSSRDINEKLAVFSRIRALLELVENQLENKDNSEILNKKLNRIRKYLIYRIEINQYALKGKEGKFIEILNSLDGKNNKEQHDIIQDDLFLLRYKLFLKNSDEDKIIDAKEKMKNLDLFEKFHIPSDFPDLFVFDDYTKIENYLKSNAIRQYKAKLNSKIEFGLTIKSIAKLAESDEFVKTFIDNEYVEMVSKIFNVSKHFKMTLFNTVFSKLLSFQVSKDYRLIKSDGSDISIFELKFLLFVRNSYELDINFSLLIDNLINNDDIDLVNLKANNELLDVLPGLVKEVRKTSLIFNIIDVHHYVHSLWSNGSLVFRNYTSHNETHSIQIIRTVNMLLKTIEGLTLNYFEKYLIYMSAYLHDVSLAIPPNKGEFNIKPHNKGGSKQKANEVINDLLKSIRTSGFDEHEDTHKVHELTLSYIDFLSEEIRLRHAYLSAKYIEKKKELMFIDKAHKSFIAEISKYHTIDDISDYPHKNNNLVYDRPEIDREKLVKLLRISDVMDITNQRVKKIYLENNLNYMTDYSKFQWVSHLITDDVIYESNTIFNNDKNTKHPLEENIRITVYLNYINLELVDYIGSLTINTNHDNETVIKFEDTSTTKKLKIPFSINWFISKNKYLFTELKIFEDMLNAMYKFSKTRFEIIIKYSNKIVKIDNDLLKIVRNLTTK